MLGELQDIWQEYAGDRSPELRRKLIEAYAPLARYVVERLNIRPGAALSYDDLLGQAAVGLIDAVDRFDPGRGIKFETYAYHRIRGSVMDMLREMDWVPRAIRQKGAQLSSAYAMLEGVLNRPPDDEELAGALGVSVGELEDLAHALALQAMQSLDEMVGAGDYDAGTMLDLIPDGGKPSPEEQMERDAERELLAHAVDALPETERTVISLYYYEGLTLKEIGQVLGVTESRVCQIHGKAMLRLKADVESQLACPERVADRVPGLAKRPQAIPGASVAQSEARGSHHVGG